MKAEEVRIGNWWNPKYPMQIEHGDISNLYVNDSDFEPIPLTVEWLVKFGFKLFTQDEDYAIDLNLPNKRLYIPLDKDYEARVTWHYNMFSIAKDIKYVHQLQNLYFALTGKELNIQL